jgi:hypothetical protein
VTPILGIWASAFAKSAPDTGSYFPLGEVTLASDTSTVTFDNIPNTYKHLQLRLVVRTSNTDNLRIRFNNDSGSNYATHQLQGNGSSVASNATSSVTQIEYLGLVTSSTDYPFSSVIDILDYTNTNKNKTVRALSGQDGNATGTATNWRVGLHSGFWNNTAAVNRIDFTSGPTFRSGSTFALFGVLA